MYEVTTYGKRASQCTGDRNVLETEMCTRNRVFVSLKLHSIYDSTSPNGGVYGTENNIRQAIGLRRVRSCSQPCF